MEIADVFPPSHLATLSGQDSILAILVGGKERGETGTRAEEENSSWLLMGWLSTQKHAQAQEQAQAEREREREEKKREEAWKLRQLREIRPLLTHLTQNIVQVQMGSSSSSSSSCNPGFMPRLLGCDCDSFACAVVTRPNTELD